MKRILYFLIFSLTILGMPVHSAVVGAGMLQWEQFHDDELRVNRYNLSSVNMYRRSNQAEVWMHTEFKRPVKGPDTLDENGQMVEIKYVFQKLVFDCMDQTYTQYEFIVFRWSDEAKVGQLQTHVKYSIVSGSPMERLRGIVCYNRGMNY